MDRSTVKELMAIITPNVNIAYRRFCEIRKFKDARRKEIASQYQLTSEQKEEIDNLFINNYGEKIDYVWHQNYAAHAGQFDYKFFPELLYIPEFEAFQNQNRSAIEMMSDKNFLPMIAKFTGVKMPNTIVSCTNGILRDGENKVITPSMAKELIDRQEMCFVKPSVDSCSGDGCIKLTGNSTVELGRDTLKILGWGGYFNNFVVQKVVECHESIRALYAGSVNTFRIITYFWKGNIEVMPIIMRIGRDGNYLDNAHQGGMFCAVHDNGMMGDHAVTEFNEQFKEHPDTHTVFATHKIEHMDSVTNAAKAIHTNIPQIGVVNWDFTIDAAGDPVLIEANVQNGSVWLPQMAHGVGAFGHRTAEVLQWLRFMKKQKPCNRSRFVGGYME